MMKKGKREKQTESNAGHVVAIECCRDVDVNDVVALMLGF